MSIPSFTRPAFTPQARVAQVPHQRVGTGFNLRSVEQKLNTRLIGDTSAAKALITEIKGMLNRSSLVAPDDVSQRFSQLEIIIKKVEEGCLSFSGSDNFDLYHVQEKEFLLEELARLKTQFNTLSN
jgi:hypothetical protein